jgi:spermidine synthase
MNRVTPQLIRECVLLFLVGICLSIAQFLMIRDFVAILYGEEVVIILVTAAFFTGLSIGYVLSRRLPLSVFKYLFLASIFIHLSFPFSYRYLAVFISNNGDSGAAYMGLMFLYALLFSSMFACFLPQLVHGEDDGADSRQRLKIFYSVELLGFVVGFIIIGWSWNKVLSPLLMVYWAFLTVILYLALKNWILTGVFAALAIWASFGVDIRDMKSTELLYQYKHGQDDISLLYSINSPYQKVEVLQKPNGGKYLYLDGLQNLNSSDLEVLNYYIAKVPAKLTQPERALIIGNGTLSSVSKVYPYTKKLTSVELDSGVLKAGQQFFTPPETLQGLDRWNLVIDDGKHFLKTSKEKFDLVIMDIPSPLTVQEAILHTAEFYKLVRSRMDETGVIAVQLSGPLQQNNRTPARVTAALAMAFKEIMVLDSEEGDRSFAYASDKLPFTVADVRSIAEPFEDEDSLKIIPPSDIPFYLVKAEALQIDTLDLVLRRGWERFMGRYFED